MAKITREAIVRAGVELIEADGAAGFSMRRLAVKLGVTPMAVYYHFENREQLLHAVLHEIASHVQRPALPDAPVERALAAAGALHAYLRANPWAIPLIAYGRTDARPGIWVTEALVESALGAGRDDEQAFAFARTVLVLVVGQVTAFPADDDAPAETELAEIDHAAGYVERLTARWAQYDARFSAAQLHRATIEALLR